MYFQYIIKSILPNCR